VQFAVDSSIWICAFKFDEKDHPLAFQFTLDVLNQKHSAISPFSAYVEVVSGLRRRMAPAADARHGALKWGERLLGAPSISWKTIDRPFAMEAAHVGARHALRGMDALIAATDVYFGIPLLTEDAEFLRLDPSVQIVRLRDLYGDSRT
jgi:predicted nucleic acid-binding protein